MKYVGFHICCMLLSALTYANQSCFVTLLNGDHFRADYLGQDQAFALFQVEWQEAPLQVHGKFISKIDFGRKDPFPRGDWEVDLGNDERIYADLISYDNQTFFLKPSWTDPINIDSRYLKSLSKGIKKEQVLYAGPDKLDGWKYKTLRGELKDLASTDGIASSDGILLKQPGGYFSQLPVVKRSFGLKIRFRFPALSRAGSFGINLKAFSNMQGREQPVLITFQTDEFNIRLMDERQRLGRLQSTQINAPLQPGRSYDLWVEFDRGQKRFRIKFEDQILFEWEESDLDFSVEPVPLELVFVLYRSSLSSLLIEEVFLYEQEGIQPVNAAQKDRTLQGVEFTNGDFLHLGLQEIKNGGEWFLELKETGELLILDATRIRSWRPASGETFSMKRKANHIGIQLSGGGESFIAELVSGDQTMLHLKREGISETFRLPFSRVEVLTFNPYFKP